MGADKNYSGLFEGIRLKVAGDSDGTMHILANSRNNALARLKASDGNTVPEEDSAVFGAAEGERMAKAGKVSGIGGKISGFYGLDAKDEGVLAVEGNAIDELVFLSRKEIDLASGEDGKAFARVSREGEPELFFLLGMNETPPKGFRLAEGSMKGYEMHNLDGTTYYPLVIGAKEAKEMREEKLFVNTGDAVRGMFGKNFVVSGVLEETGTSMDVLHFVSLNESELGG